VGLHSGGVCTITVIIVQFSGAGGSSLCLVSGCILWLTMAAKFAEAKLFSFAEYPRWVRYLLYGLWLPALLGLAAPLAFVATTNNAPHGVVLMLWLFPVALASVFVVVFVYEAWTRRNLVSAFRKGLLRSVGWLLWVFYLLFMLVAQGPA
jgi:hypothetical protein